MVTYYVHPLTTLCIVLVVVSLIGGLIASLNGFAEMIVNSGELTKSFKTSRKVAGWCLLLVAIGIIGMVVLNHNQDRPLSSIDSYISVEGSTVTIEALPNYHKYSTLDNDTHPNEENRQVFKFVENPEYKSAYLVAEDGGKLKLSDEDKDYLKQRMDK